MKQFKYEDKVEVLKQIDSGMSRKIIAYKFYQKHKARYDSRGLTKSLISRRIRRLFLDWEIIRDNFGMEKLKLGGGNRTGNQKGRSKKVSINDLTENDRRIYQEIMEDIMKSHDISKSEIVERMKKKKDEIDNKKGLAGAFNINRTNIYYVPKKNVKVFSYDVNLLIAIWRMIQMSKKSIGRDKTHKTLINDFPVTTYVFRRHWEALQYKSNYRIKYNAKPKEIKYKGIWTNDKVKFNFDCNYENEVWFSDITYVKIGNRYELVLLIIDGFTKKLVYFKRILDRKSSTIIQAIKMAKLTAGEFPKIFHTDHGVEYANNKLKNFLEDKNIIQSMSPKGNSLANRPSEFLFSTFKREFLYPYTKEINSSYKLEKTINEFEKWYHNFRVQSCLGYKTPYEYSRMMSNNNVS